MNQQDMNDPLKALREELADKSPSPEFAARVRQGIDAADGMRGESWLSGLTGWRWLVPAAAAAVIVIAVFVMSRPGIDAPKQVSVKAPVNADATVPNVPEAATLPAPRAAAQRASSSNSQVPPSPGLRRTSRTPKSGLSAVNVEASFPEVITNQPAILRALWTRVDSKTGLVESVAKTSPDTVPEIVVSPIEVNPIVIKWLGDPQTAPGAPIIRRVTADLAERSAK